MIYKVHLLLWGSDNLNQESVELRLYINATHDTIEIRRDILSRYEAQC